MAYEPIDRDLLSELQDLGEKLAIRAGDLLRDARATIGDDHDAKKNVHDIVTQADRDSEELITQAISTARPDDGIIGEEGAARESRNGITWINDPCDGTRNYAKGGRGLYGVSLGVEVNGVSAVGIVLDVQNDTLYTGANGLGAYRDGQAIRVSGVSQMQTATIGFDGAMDFATKLHQRRALALLWPQVGDMRRIGCTSLDYCFVADGTFDGMFGHGNGPWDIAAGRVIASEAGATVGSSRGNIPLAHDNIAATPGIFRELQHTIAKAGPYSP